MSAKSPPSAHPDDHVFTREVKRARYLSGLTMDELAAQAGLAHRATISWIEHGHGTGLRIAVHVCQVLGISLDQLYGLGAYAEKPPEGHVGGS